MMEKIWKNMEKGIWKEIPYHLGYFLGFFEMTLGAVFCFFAPMYLTPNVMLREKYLNPP